MTWNRVNLILYCRRFNVLTVPIRSIFYHIDCIQGESEHIATHSAPEGYATGPVTSSCRLLANYMIYQNWHGGVFHQIYCSRDFEVFVIRFLWHIKNAILPPIWTIFAVRKWIELLKSSFWRDLWTLPRPPWPYHNSMWPTSTTYDICWPNHTKTQCNLN